MTREEKAREDLTNILERMDRLEQRMRDTAKLEKIMEMVKNEEDPRKKILLFKLQEEEMDCLLKKLRRKDE